MAVNKGKNILNISDSECFKVVYEKYFSTLEYFASRYIDDNEVVCDLLQDFFMRLWENGGVFADELALKVYVYRGVRNNCLCWLRDEKRRKKSMQEYEPEETEETFVNKMIESEVYSTINKIFEELPPATRLVYAKSLEGKKHSEIAEELGIAINTIKKHKNNANNYLREHLEHLLCFIAYVA